MDLVLTVLPPAPPKIQNCARKKGHFEVFFFTKTISLDKQSICAKSMLTSDGVIFEQPLSLKIEFLKY